MDPRKTTVDLSKFGEDKGNSESFFTFTARDKNGNPVETNSIFGSKIINNETGAGMKYFFFISHNYFIIDHDLTFFYFKYF